ncbi:hypothetical protein MNBD_GAMMA11-1570 [hydrothermal vent metagenome]|uniref:Uncharacterized protein n=1 Tax=hydrothermal vent metagenome TaxID=652676 RepID=A0A3B0X6M4_9ZZZZ
MTNVFLVKTPLQLLNAIEARHYFNLDLNDCVLIAMGDRKSQPQILMLLDDINEWGEVIDLNDVDLFCDNPFELKRNGFIKKIQKLKIFRKSFFYIIRLNKISKCLSSVKYIFVGYTRYTYMSHFVNITNHDELVFLDDGNGTINYAERRRVGANAVSGISMKKKVKLYAKRLFQRVQDQEKESACFFTAYDISPGDKDKVIKNNFLYLKSKVSEAPSINEVYFIGSPLSEVGIVSSDYYVDHLNRIKKYFKNKKIVYIAHRRDSEKKLQIIKDKLGISVVFFDYPIEYQLAFVGPRPLILASFFSAALDSCRLIFGEKINLVSFKIDAVNSLQRESINDLYKGYELFKNDSFKVVSDY